MLIFQRHLWKILNTDFEHFKIWKSNNKVYEKHFQIFQYLRSQIKEIYLHLEKKLHKNYIFMTLTTKQMWYL